MHRLCSFSRTVRVVSSGTSLQWCKTVNDSWGYHSIFWCITTRYFRFRCKTRYSCPLTKRSGLLVICLRSISVKYISLSPPPPRYAHISMFCCTWARIGSCSSPIQTAMTQAVLPQLDHNGRHCRHSMERLACSGIFCI